jgi:hypothetical protein
MYIPTYICTYKHSQLERLGQVSVGSRTPSEPVNDMQHSYEPGVCGHFTKDALCET